MKTYLARTWVSAKLVPGKSQVHGNGVFATTPIARGEKIMEFGGDPITADDVAAETHRTRSIWIVRPGQYLGVPESDTRPSLDENLNHSCDANSWLVDEVTLVARRDIAAGEEITLDQGTWNFDEGDYAWDQHYCSCGSSHCRGGLTEADWKRADVQQRYRGHFHPLVQDRIETGG